MKRILVLSLMVAGGLIGFYWKPSPSRVEKLSESASTTPTLRDDSPVLLASSVASNEVPSPKPDSPEVVDPLPASHSEIARALPDQDVVKQSRELVTEEWARTRERILQDEFQVSPETLSNLDQRNKSYLKEISKFIKPTTPEQINQISERYQKDVTQLLGETAFHRLVAERSRLVERYRFDGYSIPLSIY